MEGQVNYTMPKARGAGSIVQLEKDKPRARCRKWQLRVFVGRDGKGRTKTRTRRFEGTYRQAVDALREFSEDVGKGNVPTSDGRMTVRGYFERFHEARKKSGNFTPRSLKAEEHSMRNVLDMLGDKRMCDVTARDVEEMYATLRTEGGRSHRPLKQSTILTIHRYIKVMWNHAIATGDVPEGALRGLRTPKAKPPEKKALTDEQARVLAGKLRVLEPRHIAVLLCLECGLRRSEALALKWDKVSDGCVQVAASLNEDCTMGPPKSESGRRKVPVPERTWSFLMEWKDGLLGTFEDCEYVCSDGDGPLSPQTITAWWIKHRGEFGVDCTLHELRHTYITRLVRAGANPKVVQKLAGHATIKITMEVYAHVEDDDIRDAVRLLG